MDKLIRSVAKYKEPDELERAMQLFVTGVGMGHKTAKGPLRRRLNEYAVVMIQEGAGLLWSGESATSHAVHAGDAFILFPGIPHSYYPTSPSGWNEIWVTFDGPYADLLTTAGTLDSSNPLYRSVSRRLPHYFMAILGNLDRDEPVGHAMSRTLIDLLFELRITIETSIVVDERVERAKALIARDLSRPLDFETLSSELGTCYSNVRKIFKRTTGKSMKSYHLALRMNRAKELLKGTRESVKRIALELGFDDPHYFSRLFSSRTGVSPTRWRE